MSHWQSRQFQNCSEVKSFPKLSILHADEAVLDRSDLLCEDDSYNGADSSSLHWPIFDAHTADTSGSSSHSNDFDPLAAHMNRDGLVSRHTGEGSADSGICKGRFDASNHSMASRRSTREVHNLSRDQSILSIPHSSRVISTISSNGGGWTASDGAFTADGISDYHHGSTTTSLPLKLETLAFQDAETSALPPLDTTLGGPKATSSSSIASSGPELYSSPESDGGLCSDYPRDNRPSSSSGSRRSLRHHMAGDISSVAGGSMHGNCDKDILDLRKTRHKCTADQLLQLQAFFETNRNPKGKVREELANRLGMPERSVQIWFQNKRARLRRVCKTQGLKDSGDLDVWALMSWVVPGRGKGLASRSKAAKKIGGSRQASMASDDVPWPSSRFVPLSSGAVLCPPTGHDQSFSAASPGSCAVSSVSSSPTPSGSPRAKTKAIDDGADEGKLVPPKMSRTSLSSRSDRSNGENTSRRGSRSNKSTSESSQTLTPLPAFSLCIGTWRRVAPLTCFYSRRLRTLSWTLKADSVGFKIDVPVTSVRYLTFNGPVAPSMSELAEGIHQQLGLLKVELEKPPQFFMETFRSAEPLGEPEAPKNLWRQCDDFTERQEGTYCPSHVLSGPFEALRAAVISLRESDPVMRERLGLYDSVTTGIDASICVANAPVVQQGHSREPLPPPPLLRQYSWGQTTPSFGSHSVDGARGRFDSRERMSGTQVSFSSQQATPNTQQQNPYQHWTGADSNWPYAPSQVSPSMNYAGVGDSSNPPSIHSFGDESSNRNSLGTSLHGPTRPDKVDQDSPGQEATYDATTQPGNRWHFSAPRLGLNKVGPWRLSAASPDYSGHDSDYMDQTASYVHDGQGKIHAAGAVSWGAAACHPAASNFSPSWTSHPSGSSGTKLEVLSMPEFNAAMHGAGALVLYDSQQQSQAGSDNTPSLAQRATLSVTPPTGSIAPTSDALFLAMQADDQPMSVQASRPSMQLSSAQCELSEVPSNQPLAAASLSAQDVTAPSNLGGGPGATSAPDLPPSTVPAIVATTGSSS